jgi:hypothetical protein
VIICITCPRQILASGVLVLLLQDVDCIVVIERGEVAQGVDLQVFAEGDLVGLHRIAKPVDDRQLLGVDRATLARRAPIVVSRGNVEDQELEVAPAVAKGRAEAVRAVLFCAPLGPVLSMGTSA